MKKTLAGAILLLVGIALALVGWFISKSIGKEVAEHGIKTTAEIVEIQEVRKEVDPETGEESTDHIVKVWFEAENGTVVAELPGYSSDYKVGQKVEIYYMENEPAKVRFVDQDKTMLYIFCGVGAFCALFGIILLSRRRTSTM